MLPPRTPLGRTGLTVSRMGYGTLQLGRRCSHLRTPSAESLSEPDALRLLNEVLDLGINLIDTSPAYGISEELIGQAISHRRGEFVLSTKVGELRTENGVQFDYSRRAVQLSLEQSFRLLKTEQIDLIWIASNGNDHWIQNETPVIETLQKFQQQGRIRAIGLSCKTVGGARLALDWADALMIDYNPNDRSQEEVIKRAASLRKAVLVKQGLSGGHRPPETAIPFVMQNRLVSSMLISSLNSSHLRQNLKLAAEAIERSQLVPVPAGAP